jgi:isopentenyldiphosphate isomerase
MTEEFFDIIDGNDEIVGRAPRSEAHKKGLLHRAVHVLFVTPAGEAVLQRRSATKDTYPGYLTVTVGGHVTSGSSYDETAVTEIFEETGLRVELSALAPVGALYYDIHDPLTGAHDRERVKVYGHVFRGRVSDLKIEAGEGTGFELCRIEDLRSMPVDEIERRKIVPGLFSETHYVPLYPKFLELLPSPLAGEGRGPRSGKDEG